MGLDKCHYRTQKPEGFAIGLADVMIALLNYCEYANIDIDEAMRLKMAYDRNKAGNTMEG